MPSGVDAVGQKCSKGMATRKTPPKKQAAAKKATPKKAAPTPRSGPRAAFDERRDRVAAAAKKAPAKKAAANPGPRGAFDKRRDRVAAKNAPSPGPRAAFDKRRDRVAAKHKGDNTNTRPNEFFATGRLTAKEQKFITQMASNLAKDPNYKFDAKDLQRFIANNRRG